jgi:hypothetical protein
MDYGPPMIKKYIDFFFFLKHFPRGGPSKIVIVFLRNSKII